MLKVLNVVISDKKFIDAVIEAMLQASDTADNHFCYCGSESIDNVTSHKDLVKHIVPDTFVEYVTNEGFDVVTMQTFRALPLKVIVNIPKHIKVVWHSWGFDIYSTFSEKPLVDIPLYHTRTKIAMWMNWRQELAKLHGRYELWKQRKLYKQAINRIDYFSGILPDEYELVKKANGFFRAKHVLYTVGSAPLSAFSECKGDNILVGNSGDPTNNHIDAYTILNKADLGKLKVYSFLSYGGDEQYVKRVIKAGKKLLGDNFHPIVDFLSFEDFSRIIASCGHVVMFHERQQALGNINTAIRNGCKVYLSETSVTYKSYMSSDIRVFSIQNELNAENLATQLTTEQAKCNYDALAGYWSPVPVDRLRNIYKQIEEDNSLK